MRKKKLANCLHDLFCKCLIDLEHKCERKSDGKLTKTARALWMDMADELLCIVGNDVAGILVSHLWSANDCMPLVGDNGLISFALSYMSPKNDTANAQRDGISSSWFDSALLVSTKLGQVVDALDIGEPNDAKAAAQKTARDAYDVITQALGHIRSACDYDETAGVCIPRR